MCQNQSNLCVSMKTPFPIEKIQPMLFFACYFTTMCVNDREQTWVTNKNQTSNILTLCPLQQIVWKLRVFVKKETFFLFCQHKIQSQNTKEYIPRCFEYELFSYFVKKGGSWKIISWLNVGLYPSRLAGTCSRP